MNFSEPDLANIWAVAFCWMLYPMFESGAFWVSFTFIVAIGIGDISAVVEEIRDNEFVVWYSSAVTFLHFERQVIAWWFWWNANTAICWRSCEIWATHARSIFFQFFSSTASIGTTASAICWSSCEIWAIEACVTIFQHLSLTAFSLSARDLIYIITSTIPNKWSLWVET